MNQEIARFSPIVDPDDQKIIYTLIRDKRKYDDRRPNKPRGALWVLGSNDEREQAYFGSHRRRGYDFRFVAAPRATGGKGAWYWEQRRSPWKERFRPRRQLAVLAGPILESLTRSEFENPRIVAIVAEEVARKLYEGDTMSLKIARSMLKRITKELNRSSPLKELSTEELAKADF